jgi:hypothetical protein
MKHFPTINGRTWTRRIQWLDGYGPNSGLIKLKLEDGQLYKEVLATEKDADTIWQRFNDGQPIDDCLSILGRAVPQSLKSRKATRTEKGTQS